MLSNLDILSEENEHLLCSLCDKKYKDAHDLDLLHKENFLYSDTVKSGIKIVWRGNLSSDNIFTAAEKAWEIKGSIWKK